MGKLLGIPEAMVRLEREIHRIKNRSLKGLINVQAKIYSDMDNIPPVIPVDFNNLRQSFYSVTSNGAVIRGGSAHFNDTRKDAGKLRDDHTEALSFARNAAIDDGKMRGPTICLGFSAYYAEAVHENYGANFKRRGAGAGFFAAAVKNNIVYMRHTLKEMAKIPK